MNLSRIKQLEKRLSKMFNSVENPGVYFVMKWQNERFERVEATKEEAEEYNRSVKEALAAVYSPKESNV